MPQCLEMWDAPQGQVLVRVPLPTGVLCGLVTSHSFPAAMIRVPLFLKQVYFTSLPSEGCLGEEGDCME